MNEIRKRKKNNHHPNFILDFCSSGNILKVNYVLTTGSINLFVFSYKLIMNLITSDGIILELSEIPKHV